MSAGKRRRNIAVRDKSGELSPSRFTGGHLSYFLRRLALLVLTILSLSLAYPALKCWYMRWEVRHTVIQGRNMYFDGRARQLYGKYLLWLLWSVLTLSVYYFVKMKINLIKWQTKHTHVEGIRAEKSRFSGFWFTYWGHRLLGLVVTIFTLGLGAFWAECHMERWMASKTVLDGYQLSFEGRAIQYFGRWLWMWILTVLTLGIYSIWKDLDICRWRVKHTVFRPVG